MSNQIPPLLQRQTEEEEEEILQAKEIPGQTTAVTPDVQGRINAMHGARQPLPDSERAFFEPRFGHDFSKVRVHTDAGAAASAHAVKARAFTVGHDIVFGPGQFSPGTPSGRLLVAHELTHTIQQQAAGAGCPHCHNELSVAGQSKLQIGAPNDNYKQEADRVAEHVMRQTDEFGPTEPLEGDVLDDVDLDSDDDFELESDDGQEGLDPDVDIDEQSPLHEGRKVGSWGVSWVNDLVAAKRVAGPMSDSGLAIGKALEAGPAVVLKEYGGYSVYSLNTGWSALGFTNDNTQHPGQEQEGFVQADVTGSDGVIAFTTEDIGWMTPWMPPGKEEPDHSLWYRHYGLPEDALTAAGQNTVAFLTGFAAGWNMDYEAFRERMGHMALLNAVFPTVVTAGALHGLLNEALDLLQLINPEFWETVYEGAKTVLWALRDPQGEGLAYAVGQGVARGMSGSIDDKVKEGVVAFSYEFGKIVGPILIEIVLFFLGIEIGLLKVLKVVMDILDAMGDFSGLTTKLRKVVGHLEGAPSLRSDKGDLLDVDSPRTDLPDAPRVGRAGHIDGGNLTREEVALLLRTWGDKPVSYADAAAELALVRRSEKGPNTDAANNPDYQYEVDLGNEHTWRQKKEKDGTLVWCRFSIPKATHCTPEGQRPGSAAGTSTANILLDKAQLQDKRRELTARFDEYGSGNRPDWYDEVYKSRPGGTTRPEKQQELTDLYLRAEQELDRLVIPGLVKRKDDLLAQATSAGLQHDPDIVELDKSRPGTLTNHDSIIARERWYDELQQKLNRSSTNSVLRDRNEAKVSIKHHEASGVMKAAGLESEHLLPQSVLERDPVAIADGLTPGTSPTIMIDKELHKAGMTHSRGLEALIYQYKNPKAMVDAVIENYLDILRNNSKFAHLDKAKYEEGFNHLRETYAAIFLEVFDPNRTADWHID